MKKKGFGLSLIGCVVMAVILGVYAETFSAAPKTYSARIYVAGMGGHFAQADITIDPSASSPIVIKALDRIEIGDASTHPTHDARIDANGGDALFWSTYKKDESNGGVVHVGKSDLKTGKVVKDVALPLDPRATWTGALYCASGQSKDLFIPVTMTNEAYIDLFDKETLEHKRRVFLDGTVGDKNYLFFHGTNTHDMEKFVVAINKATTPAAQEGKLTGHVDFLMLDLPALEKGEVKVLNKNSYTNGSPGKTITFRQSFTPDGKYLLQSAGDRFLLMDGKTLQVLDEETAMGGQNHDVIPTPDGKYALLTLRSPVPTQQEDTVLDGTIQLYDMEKRAMMGEPVSVCGSCHKAQSVDAGWKKGNAILCGIDARWQ